MKNEEEDGKWGKRMDEEKRETISEGRDRPGVLLH